ncbi:MAG: M48 family metallopeptidase [Bacteroidales bacterium]|nr:M48 family metallopeptidase [Bacteroidales bacterium]
MKKVVLQGIVVVLLFLFTWFAMDQVNWMSAFNVQKTTEKTEEKLGELLWDVFKSSEEEIKAQFVTASVDSILVRLCKSNDINREEIKLHILKKDQINAFALPDGHIVIFTGLMDAADDQNELAGVMAHELAHIKQGHVMQRLTREIGISVLLSMASGNSGSTVIRDAAKMLSSSAFDRNMEREADFYATEYMANSQLDPEALARFLFRLSLNENENLEKLVWISSHPASRERAEYIVEHAENLPKTSDYVLKSDTWKKILSQIRMEDEYLNLN